MLEVVIMTFEMEGESANQVLKHVWLLCLPSDIILLGQIRSVS